MSVTDERSALAAMGVEPFVFHGGRSNYGVFRDTVCEELFGVTTASRPPESFDVRARFVNAEHSTLVLIENRGASEFCFERTALRVAAERSPLRWAIGVCFAGGKTSETPAGREITTAGSVGMLPSHLGHTGTMLPGSRFGVLFIPDAIARATCDTNCWGPQLLPGSPIGRILTSHLLASFQELPQLAQSELEHLVPSMLPLLDAVISGSRDALERARPSIRTTRRRRIMRFIEDHLADPRLRPAWIASSLAISPRYLHALFAEDEHSIGETILALRLTRCRDAILDPRNKRLSLTEIAFRWGFSSASHFSRVFRRRYGIAPSDLRRM